MLYDIVELFEFVIKNNKSPWMYGSKFWDSLSKVSEAYFDQASRSAWLSLTKTGTLIELTQYITPNKKTITKILIPGHDLYKRLIGLGYEEFFKELDAISDDN